MNDKALTVFGYATIGSAAGGLLNIISGSTVSIFKSAAIGAIAGAGYGLFLARKIR